MKCQALFYLKNNNKINLNLSAIILLSALMVNPSLADPGYTLPLQTV